MRIIIVLNSSWNIVNFRLGLMQFLKNAGHELIAIAPRDEYTSRIPFEYHELPMQPNGRNPFVEIGLIWRIFRLYLRLKPDLVLHFTPKPNIYGSLVAASLGIDSISNIAGLGRGFTNNLFMKKTMEYLYRFALRSNYRVFFQNLEDMENFVEQELVTQVKSFRIPGSGINLEKFKTSVPLSKDSEFRFIMVSRMLWEKGVGDFVSAAKILKERGCQARFQLLGFLNEKNPASINRAQMARWVEEGYVEYLGISDDVKVELDRADCIVLPSVYREGVPRTLLEGAALSKPIVAYENVGVVDVVEHGLNGFLVPQKNVVALADAMMDILGSSSQVRVAMGIYGRKKVEREFDEKLIFEAYLLAIFGLLEKKRMAMQ